MNISNISEGRILDHGLVFCVSSLDSDFLMVIHSNGLYLGLYEPETEKERSALLERYPWKEDKK